MNKAFAILSADRDTNRYASQDKQFTSLLGTRARTVLLALIATIIASAAMPARSSEVELTLLGSAVPTANSERLRNNSASQKSFGVRKDRFGIEATYVDSVDVTHTLHHLTVPDTADDIRGRKDVKFLVDVSTPLTPRSRVYSRVGMYLWDVDINDSGVSRAFDVSRGANSQIVGVGAAFGADNLRWSVDIEQLGREADVQSHDVQRVWFNVTSRF